jgi:hypothetical protein
MAYDDYLNKDKGLRGGVMDAPDRQVRIAQAKIAAGAAHLLTAKEWSRIAERQRLEQESLPMAMTASEQANRARAAMNVGRPRFTAEELLAANQPGTVPAPQELKVRNIPGYGESTTVQGTEIVGGGMTRPQLPVPQEGYGYVMGPTGYISTTPYGMVRGETPQVQDVQAGGQTQAEQPVNLPVFNQAPAAMSQFEQQLVKPPVSMATGMKSIEELLPSLSGTPQRANETVADLMRGAFYGATNVMRPSMWTGTTTPSGAAAAVYTPERSPEYLGQLTSRLEAMSDKTSPRAVSLQNEINRLSQATPAAPITTDVLGISQAKPKMTPDMVASQILGPAIPRPQAVPVQAPATQPALGGMTVSAMIPEGVTGQTELAPQYVEQPMPMAIPQASQFQTYRPPELRIPQFNPRNIMQQPSVSETLRLPGELKAYEAQTKAQIAAYRANVSAQRNAMKDAIDAELKSADIAGKQASTISTQIANQFAMGGPQYGTFDVDGKTFGYIRSSPTSIQKFEIKPSESTTERNYNFREGINKAIADKVQANDMRSALIMYQSLGLPAQDFATFVGQLGVKPESGGSQTAETQVSRPSAQRIRNPKTGEVKELRNGQWVTVK